ncbi:MAG: hypothetical protein DRP42_01840 [Tenericutes bacterium]|nr:MAG: hypothetical protein DRP42_01840 [Mycoplasmatota bacterium]
MINSISERQTLENENVNFEDINILLSNVQLFNLYKELGISSIAFIKNLLMGTLKDASLTLSNLSLKLEDYKNIISLLKDSKMTSTEAKVLIINSAKESVTDEIAKLSSREALTIEDLKLLIIEIDNENPELKDERPVRKLKFVMGQLMKKTKGAINAKEAMELLKEHYEIT